MTNAQRWTTLKWFVRLILMLSALYIIAQGLDHGHMWALCTYLWGMWTMFAWRELR